MGGGEAALINVSAQMSYRVGEFNSSVVTAYGDAGAYNAEATGDSSAPAAVSSGHLLNGGDDQGSYLNAVEVGAPGDNENAAAAVSPNGEMAPTVNGDRSDNVIVKSASLEFVDGSVSTMSAEEERLWCIVKANSLDFNAWTALIEETEKAAENNILAIRKIYDTFLDEFPLCYGYWKKYADHEVHVGTMDKVIEVYERAVQAVTYSVDIWLLYCAFTIETYGDPETVRSMAATTILHIFGGKMEQYAKCCWEDLVQLRAKMACVTASFGFLSGRLFERGLAYVGSDYLSFPLWDKYIEYEYMHQEWGRLSMIYTRILEMPIQQLDKYFNGFKELTGSLPLSEFRISEETAAPAAGAVSENVVPVGDGQGHFDATGQPPKPDSVRLTEDEELKKYIAIREETYKKAKEFESKVLGFEAAIRRPYFHVRPLNIAELENWHNYLDFMEKEGDLEKLVKLYERCLIACANYPEYWIRYVLCMEANGSLDRADNALARSTQVFVKKQPEIHLFAARFKEQIGDVTGARAAYQLVHTEITPGLLEAIVKHANMERRLGNLNEAFSLYEQAIAIEKGKEHSQTLAMLYAQYARFIFLVSGNAEKAREVLFGALDHVQLSKSFLEALIYFETISPISKQIDYLDSLVEKFMSPSSDNIAATTAEHEDLSSILLEFLGLFGNVKSIKKAEDRHAKIFLPHKPISELRKRNAEHFLASDKTKMAKSYSTATSQSQSVMGTHPNSHSQWPAGYSAQPQGWPPAMHAQVQWAPAYAQQAAYGVYNSYSGAYATTQAPTAAPAPVPAPAPQSVAYSAHPSTYPGQSYAQTMGATTATSAAVQQPVTYGSYY